MRHVGSWFPDQGSNPCHLHWEHGVLSTGLPWKSVFTSCILVNIWVVSSLGLLEIVLLWTVLCTYPSYDLDKVWGIYLGMKLQANRPCVSSVYQILISSSSDSEKPDAIVILDASDVDAFVGSLPSALKFAVVYHRISLCSSTVLGTWWALSIWKCVFFSSELFLFCVLCSLFLELPFNMEMCVLQLWIISLLCSLFSLSGTLFLDAGSSGLVLWFLKFLFSCLKFLSILFHSMGIFLIFIFQPFYWVFIS